jgi:hypothetical protein
MYVYLKYFAFILQQLGQFKGQEVDIIVEDILVYRDISCSH